MVRYVVYPRGVLSIPVSFKALTGASFETRIRECAAPLFQRATFSTRREEWPVRPTVRKLIGVRRVTK